MQDKTGGAIAEWLKQIGTEAHSRQYSGTLTG